MNDARIRRESILGALPPVWPEALREVNRAALLEERETLVVLDDDPTGSQTVYDIPVLTEWSVDSLRREFQNSSGGFYVLTNSRSLASDDALALNLEIARNLLEASDGRNFSVVSRSDSTLRGHFPVETDGLNRTLGPYHASLLVPYFEAGGRYTVGDTHYVADGDFLIPVAETPFAEDRVFGFLNSDLKLWVFEKSGGAIPREKIRSLSLDTIRRGGPVEVSARLREAPMGSVVVVNAAAPEDLDVVVAALRRPEVSKMKFLFRTGAEFVSAYLGLANRNSLGPERFQRREARGGLIVVGSYVPLSSRQLSHLLDSTDIHPVEISVERIVGAADAVSYLEELSDEIRARLVRGEDVVLYTQRRLVAGDTNGENLAIGSQVSEALVTIARRLGALPSFLVAKGGITSSVIATDALGVRRAMILGTIIPGTPVWRLGPESAAPGLNYVVFPGNVGGVDGLTRVFEILKQSKSENEKA